MTPGPRRARVGSRARVDSRSRVDAALRVTAALAGTVPVALAAAVCLARWLPASPAARFTAGFTLAIPIWVTAMCLTSLTRTAARAWLWCGSLTLILWALAAGAPG